MKHAAALAAFVCLLVAQPAAQQSIPAAASALVGTWTLVSIEEGVDGTAPTRAAAPRGVLILDSAGHILETTTRSGSGAGGRGAPAGGGRGVADVASAGRGATGRDGGGGGGSPIFDSAMNFSTFAGFWGSYRPQVAEKTVTLRPEGAVHPNLMGREIVRGIEVTGDRLTMTSRAGEPHTRAVTRWTWERVPTMEGLSPVSRQVVGFWQHVVERRINATTKEVLSETRRAPSVIVYSPSGYVGVHFPPLNRARFAADTPTEAEAAAATRGYVGYFGALGIYPGMVFHQILVGLSPTQGNTLKRFFSVSGDEVTITFPPGTNQQGQQTTTVVILKRLSGVEQMLPAPR